MENEWEVTKQLEANWVEDRPVINNNNTLENTTRLLQKEAQELMDSVLLYLLGQTDRKDVLQEASDVGLFLMAVFRLLDADMLAEIREKNAFNSIRYQASQFQQGEYQDIYQRLKESAKRKELREEFYAPIPRED